MKKHHFVQTVKYKKIYKRYLFICYHTFISYEEHAKSHSNEIEISEKSLKYFSNSPLCMPQKNFLKFTILDPSCNSAPNPPKLVNKNLPVNKRALRPGTPRIRRLHTGRAK